jgi:hypothetical protein
MAYIYRRDKDTSLCLWDRALHAEHGAQKVKRNFSTFEVTMKFSPDG